MDREGTASNTSCAVLLHSVNSYVLINLMLWLRCAALSEDERATDIIVRATETTERGDDGMGEQKRVDPVHVC